MDFEAKGAGRIGCRWRIFRGLQRGDGQARWRSLSWRLRFWHRPSLRHGCFRSMH